MRKKIKITFDDVYEAFMDVSKKKGFDLHKTEFILEGEDVEPEKGFSLGDIVFVLPHVETLYGGKRRIIEGRWGKVTDIHDKDRLFFVEKDFIGGWEKESDLERIT